MGTAAGVRWEERRVGRWVRRWAGGCCWGGGWWGRQVVGWRRWQRRPEKAAAAAASGGGGSGAGEGSSAVCQADGAGGAAPTRTASSRTLKPLFLLAMTAEGGAGGWRVAARSDRLVWWAGAVPLPLPAPAPQAVPAALPDAQVCTRRGLTQVSHGLGSHGLGGGCSQDGADKPVCKAW